MSHEIYKNKFVSLRQPAWHELGHVIQEEIGAVEAASRVNGVPFVYTEEVRTVSGLYTGSKAIIGLEQNEKTNNDIRTVYSVVSKDYHEITHQHFLEAWDRATHAHVETLGLLYDGSTMFLTTKLPGFSVKGDEIQGYLLATNPLNGTKAVTVRKTPVRVVCHNTLEASGKNFIAEWRVIHSSNAILQLETFLKNAYEQSRMEYEAVKDLYEILASTHIKDESAKEIFRSVYPDLTQPTALMQKLATKEPEALTELAAWERKNGHQIVHRTECYNLYAGEGLGSISEAAAGTVWGAYNAVVEYEQYLKRSSQRSSFLLGAGADRVATAFETSLAMAGK